MCEGGEGSIRGYHPTFRKSQILFVHQASVLGGLQAVPSSSCFFCSNFGPQFFFFTDVVKNPVGLARRRPATVRAKWWWRRRRRRALSVSLFFFSSAAKGCSRSRNEGVGHRRRY